VRLPLTQQLIVFNHDSLQAGLWVEQSN